MPALSIAKCAKSLLLELGPFRTAMLSVGYQQGSLSAPPQKKKNTHHPTKTEQKIWKTGQATKEGAHARGNI